MSLHGGLNLIVLKILFNENLTGSELIKKVENITVLGSRRQAQFIHY
jgi:DNA-binding PadR family transcriptional regulator